ncbi:proline dehydrogenase [Conoideocrella luteorostrata]|uniref:Proline dehydrogenase n=1 Tax=Conoideocrella luteorostrata TaxID=1105319 RepID=A0AAJ0FSH7_9HYPO|nr:proline dehydrogenase [Conoideocrella luteorostrata]
MPPAPSRGLALPLRRASPLHPTTVTISSTYALLASITGRDATMIKRRGIHSSDRKSSTVAELPGAVPPPANLEPSRAPLSVLPLSMILRSLATTAVSSSPVLLPPSLRIMTLLAHSTSPIFNPDRNPILRYFLKKSFYAQFCAGEEPAEVQATINRLKNIGFTGVILGYAREVVLTEKQAEEVGLTAGQETQKVIDNEIVPWAEGTLETVRLAQPGDFVALKFTGAGSLALHELKHRLPASPYLAKSIDSICQLAHERGIRLLFDAEQDSLQDGIDDWTMEFAKKYNTNPDSATIYGTYQAYKKIIPTVLGRHLAQAQEGNFSLGVKLVRGAYLGSDPRECFHDTKADTDACYDGIAASVLARQWNATVKGNGEYPAAHIVLATHNAESVQKARAICDAGGAKSDIAFAQLQGMADEISCELVEASQSARVDVASTAPKLPTYKYLVWGTTGECMKYLLRRAHENKDAVQRTKSGRDAMWAEVVRRVKNTLRLA